MGIDGHETFTHSLSRGIATLEQKDQLPELRERCAL